MDALPVASCELKREHFPEYQWTHCQFARKSGGLRPSNDSSMRGLGENRQSRLQLLCSNTENEAFRNREWILSHRSSTVWQRTHFRVDQSQVDTQGTRHEYNSRVSHKLLSLDRIERFWSAWRRTIFWRRFEYNSGKPVLLLYQHLLIIIIFIQFVCN